MDTLLAVHSFIRWIIMAVAVVAIVKFAVGWAANSLFKGMDRGLASGFSGLMDLQVLLAWSISFGMASSSLVFQCTAFCT